MKHSMKLLVTPPLEPRVIKPPWRKAVVLVCRKCSGNKDGDLRKWLRGRLKDDGRKKDVKVLSVGCLDVCPKRRVTVVVSRNAGESRSYVVSEEEREAFYAKLGGETKE